MSFTRNFHAAVILGSAGNCEYGADPATDSHTDRRIRGQRGGESMADLSRITTVHAESAGIKGIIGWTQSRDSSSDAPLRQTPLCAHALLATLERGTSRLLFVGG